MTSPTRRALEAADVEFIPENGGGVGARMRDVGGAGGDRPRGSGSNGTESSIRIARAAALVSRPEANSSPWLRDHDGLRQNAKFNAVSLEPAHQSLVPDPLKDCDAALPSARWDCRDVDGALNRASAVLASVEAVVEELDHALAGQARQKQAIE